MSAFDFEDLAQRTAARLDALCLSHPDRSVGSAGGQAATEFVAAEFATLGVEVEHLPFECVVWDPVGATLEAGGIGFSAHPGPYSPSVDVEAALVTAESIAQLEAAKSAGAVLLLHGALAAEQLAPKNYPFYNSEEHARIIVEIERQSPAAVIAATGANPGAVGSLSPFPLFEDGDFTVPNAYMSEVDGAKLLAATPSHVHLRIDSGTHAAHAEKLVARVPGSSAGRFVVTAHIDSRHGTPGAIDNAAGVCILLGVAENLQGAGLRRSVEFVPFNGEDNFAAYGEMEYLKGCGADLSDVALAINIDAAGYRKGASAVSTYGCDEAVAETLDAVLAGYDRVVTGPAWPQSDHMIFAMRGIPAMAVTTTEFSEVTRRYTHGPDDLPPLIDASLVAETSGAIAELLIEVDATLD